MSLRVQPFLYEMSGAPCNFLFALDFLLTIWRICAIVTEQSHVFCILISKVVLSI